MALGRTCSQVGPGKMDATPRQSGTRGWEGGVEGDQDSDGRRSSRGWWKCTGPRQQGTERIGKKQ
jgi:hypothetical protein